MGSRIDIDLVLDALLMALGIEFKVVVHCRYAAHRQLAIECAMWPMPLVAVQERLQGVGADLNLTHPADRTLTQGLEPASADIGSGQL